MQINIKDKYNAVIVLQILYLSFLTVYQSIALSQAIGSYNAYGILCRSICLMGTNPIS